MAFNIRASLAWAVPVKPDDLGAHLEAFKNSLSKLQALRLCHKYGIGEDVHITKLPAEILLALEGYVFQHAIYEVSGEWKWLFKHYESRCEPFIDHVDDPSIIAECKDAYDEELCDACQDGEEDKCESGCDEKVTQMVNKQSVENGSYWRYEDCEPLRDEWESKISQSPNGNFAKYDEVLRKHFGLEAMFIPTRKASGKAAQWPDDPNHKWHDLDEIKSTICYLTLPRKDSTEQSFDASEMEAMNGFWFIQSAQSSFVDVPTLSNRETRIRQFRNALRTLKLDPYIHPSQLKDTVSAEKGGIHDSDKDNGDPNDTSEISAKDIETKEWPQLIMLVKSVASSD